MRHAPLGFKAKHGGSPPPPPSAIVVHNSSEFAAAMAVVVPGQTIKCAAGSYAGLGFSGKSFFPPIIITSNDLLDRAVLNYFEAVNCVGFTFQHIDFKVLLPAFYGWKFDTCSRFVFTDVKCLSDGTLPADYENVVGMRFFTCTHITIQGSEYTKLGSTVQAATNSDTVLIQTTEFHDMNSDGIDLGRVTNVIISANYLHDWKPTGGNHPDAIQFTDDTSNVLISGNLIERGAGDNTQGIFAGDGTPTNLEIAGNLVAGTGASGIRVASGGNSINIHDNEVITFVGGDTTNILVQGADTVTLTNNKTLAGALATSACTNVTESGNTTIPASADAGAVRIAAWRVLNPTVPA